MKYMKPEMECVMFDVEDIITTSIEHTNTVPSEITTIPTIDPDEGTIV